MIYFEISRGINGPMHGWTDLLNILTKQKICLQINPFLIYTLTLICFDLLGISFVEVR